MSGPLAARLNRCHCGCVLTPCWYLPCHLDSMHASPTPNLIHVVPHTTQPTHFTITPLSCSLPTSWHCYHGGVNKASWLHPNYLSESLRLKLQCTIRNAWQTSTLGKYENGINWFIIFCDNENIPSNYQLPTSEFLLCASPHPPQDYALVTQ